LPQTTTYSWAILAGVITVALAVDMAIFHRKPQKHTLRTALAESAGWIALALAFNVFVYWTHGPQAGVQFLSGYVVEKSLSADNILVFLVIFRAFGVPVEKQHRVLYYGVVGALALRGLFVFAGIELLKAIHPILYAFGALLLMACLRMALPGKHTNEPERNWLVRAARHAIPLTKDPTGEQFLLKKGGRWFATNLLLALAAVEAMDIVFAVDSVPAVLAITRDAFIVYSSNAFAILGLRALYFALANILPRLRFFRQGLAAILGFVGIKMILSDYLLISDLVSLGTITAIVAATIGGSWLMPKAGLRKSGAGNAAHRTTKD
jgi:tellurite resistance protein TerC